MNKWILGEIGLRKAHETSIFEMAQMLGKKVTIVATIVKAGLEATGLDVPPAYGRDM